MNLNLSIKKSGNLYSTKKILNIIVLTVFICFSVPFLLLAETSYAQVKKVSLNLDNVTLNQVFDAIQEQSDLSFWYRNEDLKNDKMSVKAENEAITDVLDKVLKDKNLTYEMNNNYVVISKREHSITKDSQQQAKVITGKVIDNLGEPLIGVSIQVKGSITGTVTDIDGNYSLNITTPNPILVFSFVGFLSQEIAIRNQTIVNITLSSDTKLIDEVVVVGYGTQKKANLTGAVGTVNTAEALQSRPVTNVQELFAGTVPGLNVTKGSGAVGSGANINIRGTSTIGTSTGVLMIIDGFPGSINTLNPNDIESVSVLKDAASAAIYGSRAANGVILITTKKAKESQRPIIEVLSSVGVQNPQFKLDFVGSENYMKLWDQAMVNDGKDPTYGSQGIADLKAGKYADVKWYKEIYQKNTLINNNYISLSGQQKDITYRFAGSYDYQDGTLPNNNYERYIIRPDMTIKLLKNLTFRGNLQYTETHINEPQGGSKDDTASGLEYFQSQSARISPVTFITEPSNGLYGIGSSMAGNPIAGVNEGGYRKSLTKENMTILELNYSPLKNWNIIGNFAHYSYDNTYKNRVSTYYLYDADGNIAKTVNSKSNLTERSESNQRNTLQLTTDYSISFNQKHNLKFLAGYSQELYHTENYWASRDDMPFNGVDVLDMGVSNKQNGGNANELAIQSVFGRINYDYQSKYLFEANVRTDGSSRFAPGHRWGTFPSFSAGWNIKEENFMSNIDWLSSLKLRASWGLLGDAQKRNDANTPLDYYPTAVTLTYDPSMYVFNNALVAGAYNNKSVNPLISWEQAAMTNIGLDLSILNQRIRMSVDYFNNIRKNILYPAPVPFEFGLSAPYSNLVKMENRGIEVLAAYSDRSGDFSWGIDVNASSSKNKALDLGGKEYWIEGNTITRLGDQYQLPYGYIAEGLFQNQAEIGQHTTQFATLYPGNIKYKDLNIEGGSQGKINGDDKDVITRKVPIMYGFNLNFGYKQFDFSANLYGKLNVFRYLNGYEGWAFYLSQNARPMHNDAWTPENPNASYPRLTISNTSNDYIYSSYWYRKSDYLKLQNMQVGYTLPKKILEKVKIDYLRMFVSGQNIATFTKYDGFDPEGGYYPLAQTWAFGINLKF